ncbi:DUF29 domain-containing protein [Gloeothece verrucosa]|uniref:DUF29 domain-containing protein n=1 Tax=Gloeothece verrucosa (strain PCC 7822) TaxID=497965 RepID=E0U8T8_GLOV7|nr:DUF29 domain-containing protein [Gloeothece verrucosa]ADN14952.1 protein of unknown function DUF29 [Gloeothece verrucosa PCC 7822]
MKPLYEQDFLLWLEKTAYLLNHKQFEELDIKNLVEEIESMGRSEKQELESRLTTIIEHLLKLIYWTEELEYNSRGWRGTVIEQRRQLKRLLKKSPSLQSYLNEMFLECYQDAREDTLQKYELPQEMFPTVPAFTVEDILNSEYLPPKS